MTLELYDRNGKKYTLQEVEDTGWENLSGDDDSLIVGRIKNGYATIRIYNFTFTANVVGAQTKLIDLPSKYIPQRNIYFNIYTGVANPVICAALISNSKNNMMFYPKNIDKCAYFGSVSYPI